jgi:hypothetical protein
MLHITRCTCRKRREQKPITKDSKTNEYRYYETKKNKELKERKKEREREEKKKEKKKTYQGKRAE